MICDEKRDVVAWNGLSSQNNKVVGTLHHKVCEFVAKNTLDLIRLLDGNRQSDRIDRTFDENFLVFVARNYDGLEQ